MATQTQPGQVEPAKPSITQHSPRLSVDSTWTEILSELNTIRDEITKLKEAPVCLDQYGS